MFAAFENQYDVRITVGTSASTYSCAHQGRLYTNGAQWTTTQCEQCACVNVGGCATRVTGSYITQGHVSCSPSQCNPADCLPPKSSHSSFGGQSEAAQCPVNHVCKHGRHRRMCARCMHLPVGPVYAMVMAGRHGRSSAHTVFTPTRTRRGGHGLWTCVRAHAEHTIHTRGECVYVYRLVYSHMYVQGTTVQSLCYYLSLTLLTHNFTQYTTYCTLLAMEPRALIQVDLVRIHSHRL